MYSIKYLLTHDEGESIRFEADRGNKSVRNFNSSTESCPIRWLRSNLIKPGQLTRSPVCFVIVKFFFTILY